MESLQTLISWAVLKKKPFQLGYSLVELLVALGLFSVLIPILFAGFVAAREGKPQQEQRFQAATLLKESTEAVRIIRARGWANVATNGTYHPAIASGSWSLASGTETINGITRKITISSVSRNASGAIVTSGGTVDPSTKKIVIDVSWNNPLVTSLSSTSYITRYLDNLSFTHTTSSDFSLSGSVLNNTVVFANGDGSVKLSPSGPGKGNWCTPSIVGSLDLPRNGAARAVTAIEGQVFTGTGANASGVSLAYTKVSNQTPPIPTLSGTFDGYKTNDVFGVNGYAYLATDNNSKEVVIVNTTTMTEAGNYNITGNGSAQSLFISGSTGYVIAANKLYIFSALPVTGSGSQATLGSVTLAGNGSSVYVVGSQAYVTISGSSSQLQIINVANTSSPTVSASLTLNGGFGRDVYVAPSGNRAYVATAASATQPEFFLINTESKTAPSVISTYDTNGMDPQAVDMVLSGNRAVIVGVGGEEYQVVTIAPETSPVKCGSINDDSGIYDIATVVEADGDAYAYISSGNSTSELKIIEGGPGGSYSLTGSYTSAIVDTGTVGAYNRFTVDSTTTSNATLQYQVASALPVSGSCAGANYVFVGPDGTSSTYFTGDGVIPFDSDGVGYENPGRCFKYKALFTTTNMLETPLLNSMTVNYSP